MGLGSEIWKNLFRIPDPGVKKAPDPGSGSVTLRTYILLPYCAGGDAVSEMPGRFGGDSGPGSGQQHTGSILSQKIMSPLHPQPEMENTAKASAHGGVSGSVYPQHWLVAVQLCQLIEPGW
jgi:hypothetical protein